MTPPAPDQEGQPTADRSSPSEATSAPVHARGVWIRDDRQTRVRFQPRVGDGDKAASPGGSDEIKGGGGESNRVDWTFTLPLLGCMGFLGAGLCVFSSLAYAGLSTVTKQAPILTPVILGGVIAFIATVWMFRRARNRRRHGLASYHARLWVAQSLCGSCGYSLQGLGEAADGCRVCPECGAAWRVLAMSQAPSNAAAPA